MPAHDARLPTGRRDPAWVIVTMVWTTLAAVALFDGRFVVAAILIGMALLMAIGYRAIAILRSAASAIDRASGHLAAIESLLRERPAVATESPGPAPPVSLTGPNTDALNAQLEAAKVANDPQRVLELFGQLAPLLSVSDRQAREQTIARDLMALLMRRLRGGIVSVDVAVLAEKIAEAFAATREGASLRASLPTLRRSAGLCPQCAKPYVGEDDRCAQCTLAQQAAAEEPPPPEGEVEHWQPDEEVADLRRALGEES